MVEAETFTEENQVIEHFQDLRTGVMNSTDHSSALVGQHPQ